MLNKKEVIKCLASFFYIGYLPARGTIASLFPVLMYFLLQNAPLIYNMLTIFFLFAAFVLAEKAQPVFQQKDPPNMVLDEIAGMFIGFVFLPFRWTYALAGFAIFRFFDIIKVWPLGKVEKLNGAFGVVLDDLCAGVFTNIILQIVYRLT